MRIWRRRSPKSDTSPTSCTVSRTCLISLSAICVISVGDRPENTTSVRIGAESGSLLLTTGGFVSRGNRTVATLSRTSWVAASMSRSSVNVMVQFAEPWLELQRSSSMPLIVLTAASIGLVIVVSISSALAPDRPARTLTVGLSVRGIRSRPSSPYENHPSTTSATLIMTAKTGRLTLTSASFTECLLAARRRHPAGRALRRCPRRPPRTGAAVALRPHPLRCRG